MIISPFLIEAIFNGFCKAIILRYICNSVEDTPHMAFTYITEQPEHLSVASISTLASLGLSLMYKFSDFTCSAV